MKKKISVIIKEPWMKELYPQMWEVLHTAGGASPSPTDGKVESA